MDDLRKITTRLPADIIMKLKMHCVTREIPIGAVMAIAIDHYINDYEKTIDKYRVKNDGTTSTIRRISRGEALA